MAEFAKDEVRRAAVSTVEDNVERARRTRAGVGVRFARVPTKVVPCPWCAMLASRGFAYGSAQAASAGSHHHCRCTVVPGVAGRTAVAGYDPAHYEDVWRHPERYEEPKTEGESDATRRWHDENRTREQRLHARNIDAATTCPRPVFISPRGNEGLIENIKRIERRDGWYDVHAHGQPGSVMLFDNTGVGSGELAHVITSRKDYHGEPIRLFSCHSAEAGPDGHCLGSELAAIMGVDVDAAPGATTVWGDGKFTFSNTGDSEFVSFAAGGGRK